MTCARLTLTRARYSSRQPWWTIHNHLPSVRSLATQPSGSKGGISSSSSSSSSSRPGGAKGGPQPPPPSTVAYNKQRRREWVLVGVAGSAAGLGGWYFFSARTKHHAASSSAMPSDSRAFSLSSNARTSFSIPLRSSAQPGGPTHSVITTLTPSEVDKRLRENERSTNVDRPAGACLVARYDTNSVASNDPIEDKRAEVIVERDRGLSDSDRARSGPVDGGQKAVAAAAEAVPAVKGDLCFFAVMDGHAGYHTSTLLSQKLIAFVALELDKVFREAGEYANVAKAKAAMPTKMWRMLFGGPEASASPTPGGLDGDPEIVKRAIAKAFRSLDKEIVNTPVELLKEWELSLASTASSSPPGPAAPSRVAGSNAPGGTRSLSSLARSIFPSSSNVPFSGSAFTATQKSAYESILPALSGSCALLTYVDSARKDVYVACTGDSRAVAGYWDEKAGRWRVEALSVDQTGRNMSEVKR